MFYKLHMRNNVCLYFLYNLYNLIYLLLVTLTLQCDQLKAQFSDKILQLIKAFNSIIA